MIDELATQARHRSRSTCASRTPCATAAPPSTARSSARSAWSRRWKRPRSSEHYSAPLGPNQGRGVACGFWFNRGGETTGSLTIAPDGSVTLLLGPARRRRLAHVDQHDGGRGTGHSRRQGSRRHLRHQRARLQHGHGGQPVGVRRRHDRRRFRPQGDRRDVPARGEDLGRAGGRRRVRRRALPAGELECRRFRAAVDRRHRQAGRALPAAPSPAIPSSPSPARARVSAPRSSTSRSTRRPARQGAARYGDRGRRQGRSIRAGRGPVPGRRRPGHRLGAQRGVHLRRRRAAAESELPRLSHPGRLRRADDRSGHRRSAQPASILTACAASARRR